MTHFDAYMQRQHLAEATRARYHRSVALFETWLIEAGLTRETLSYRDIVAWLRTMEVGPRTKNAHLTALRHWLSWLVEEGRRLDNPADGLVIRGQRRRLPQDLLTREQLDALYQGYPAGTPAHQRNKAMLGLLVYQGLRVRELSRLETSDVDLEGGLITVPGSRQSEGRMLWLESKQILALHIYLQEVRPVLLASTSKQAGRLFVSAGSGERLHNALALLMRELRERHTFFKEAKQLRASRLALWLRCYGLREVQHMAGHRYVSSTERYRATDLRRLQASLVKHHPLE